MTTMDTSQERLPIAASINDPASYVPITDDPPQPLHPGMKRYRWLLSAVAVLIAALPAFAADSDTPGARGEQPGVSSPTNLVYASDYLSFIGRDERGYVAFALDTNRGRDGEAFQAEHFAVLHDERQGWVDLEGNGAYENLEREVLGLPDSLFFQFDGTPAAGLSVSSSTNHLALRIAPIPARHRRAEGTSLVWMGSAAATLTWRERTIPGRVIYEYVFMPDFNRLTKTYVGMWKDFQALYLLAGADSDLYVHSHQSERLAPLIGKLLGFAAFDGETQSLDDLDVMVMDHAFAPGFYRWPTEWSITWRGPEGPGSLSLVIHDRKRISNWVVGGFAMAIIRGEMTYGGTTQPIYGLAELIM
jgi:hypothetical protein